MFHISSLDRAEALRHEDPAEARNVTARGNLAVAYERQGLVPKAVEQYRTYIEQAPPGASRQMAERAIRELTGQPSD